MGSNALRGADSIGIATDGALDLAVRFPADRTELSGSAATPLNALLNGAPNHPTLLATLPLERQRPNENAAAAAPRALDGAEDHPPSARGRRRRAFRQGPERKGRS